jgi:hypothetical protein
MHLTGRVIARYFDTSEVLANVYQNDSKLEEYCVKALERMTGSQ